MIQLMYVELYKSKLIQSGSMSGRLERELDIDTTSIRRVFDNHYRAEMHFVADVLGLFTDIFAPD
jgi:hypothetical protein